MDTPDDDLALLQRWHEGSAASGEALVRRHFAALHRFFAAKGVSDVADLVQRTFLIGLERAGDRPSIICFPAWLFGIARNLLFECWRERSDFDPSSSSIAQLGPSAGSLLVFAEDHRRLAQALWRIPLDDQIVLELHYWEGLRSPELAEVLGIAEPTARGRLRRAREALRREFDATESGDEDDTIENWLAALRPQVVRPR